MAMARNGYLNTVVRSGQSPCLVTSCTNHWVSSFRGCPLTWGGREEERKVWRWEAVRQGKQRCVRCCVCHLGYMLKSSVLCETVKSG